MTEPSGTASFYQSEYREGAVLGARPPWVIGEPQTPFRELVESDALSGPVLDAGCGSGELSLYLASQGLSVTGVDISENAVERAREQAEEQGSSATFAVGSVFDLAEYEGRFRAVVDCGCLHALPTERLADYAAELHRATVPGARAHLLELDPDVVTALRGRFASMGVPEHVLSVFPSVAPDEVRDAFTEGWRVRSIEKSAIRVRFPGDDEIIPLAAWFSVFERD